MKFLEFIKNGFSRVLSVDAEFLLDLTGTIGSQQSVVLLKLVPSPNDISMIFDISDINYNLQSLSSDFPNAEGYHFLSTTDGVVYLTAKCNYSGAGGCSGVSMTVSLEFYLNQ